MSLYKLLFDIQYHGLQEGSRKLLGMKIIGENNNVNLKQLLDQIKAFCGPISEKEAQKYFKNNPSLPQRTVQVACQELQDTISFARTRLGKAEKLYNQYSKDLQINLDKMSIDQRILTRGLFEESLKRWKFQRKDAILNLAIALEKAKREGVETYFFRFDVRALTEKKDPLMSGMDKVMKAVVDTWGPQIGLI